MGIPQVNGLDSKSFEALFTGDRHVRGITTESKSCGQLYSAELRGEEDILALLGIQS